MDIIQNLDAWIHPISHPPINSCKASDLLSLLFISQGLRNPATELPLEDGAHIPCSKPILFMDDFNALNQACKNRVGVFLTGDRLVEEELREKTMLHVLPKFKFKKYEIYTC